MSLSLDQLRVIHSAIVEQELREAGWVIGANLLLVALGESVILSREDQALELLRTYVRTLLEEENYLGAATLQWSEDMVDTRPKATQDVFRFIPGGSRNLLQGAVSMSKTFSSVAFHVLDYLRDPQYTAIKMVAVNEPHMKANMFAQVLKLFRACAIPMIDDGELVIREAENYLGTKSGGNDMGFKGVAFKQSQFGSGTIRGYKSYPYRTTPHPKFGKMTRLRILGDEGAYWPEGQFSDLNSPLGSAESDGKLVRATISFNPISISVPVVRMAAPDQGWIEEDLEVLHEWVSKEGWRVLRLDAAQCENIIQRKKIYEGFQTFDAYMGFMKKGDDSAAYYVEARGFPPIKNAAHTVLPGSWVNGCWGEATFVDHVQHLFSVDLAFEGADDAIAGVARWGMASGWRRRDGSYVVFKDRRNPGRTKPRLVLQLDQLIPLIKAEDTITIAEDIMSRCKELGIPPENVVVDKSGKGAGTWSHLSAYWGNVLGIKWGESATGLKMVAEDKEGSDKICDNNVTELFWTLRRWMDPTVGAVIIGTGVPQNPLTMQLTQRRYWHLKAGKVRVESKEEYTARNKYSPNECDCILMLPAIIRLRFGEFPGVVDVTRDQQQQFGESVSHDSIDEDDRLQLASGDYAERLS